MIHDFSECGHRADLDTVRRRAHSAEFLDSAQIDHNLGLPDSILEPVEAVEPPGQHPGIRSMLFEKLLCIGYGTWLIQLECSHYVSDGSHNSPSISVKCGPSGDAASGGQLRATSESCRHLRARAGKCRLRAHLKERSGQKHNLLPPVARPRRERPPAFPGPECPTPSIACRRVHPESLAACCGGIAWKPSGHSVAPTPRAPTGVSGSGMSNAVHCMSTGTSRIVGGLLWWNRLETNDSGCT